MPEGWGLTFPTKTASCNKTENPLPITRRSFREDHRMRRIDQRKGPLALRGVFGWAYAIGFLLSLVSATAISGQEFRASISGQVADHSGSVIPGAAVTALDTATGQTYSTKTDGQGAYNLLDLLPGAYTVTVKAQSFQTAVFNNVVLESAQQRGLNVGLNPGTVTEQVVVTASGQLLDTVSASTGGVIDQVKVENMPSTGRQVWDDIALTPGIRTVATDPFDLTPRNNGNAYTVSGVPSDANAFFVNGAPVSDQGKWYFSPEQDAVQEVQASANPYDAQYGRTAGGAFNANVKSGTGKFHGSIYDYYGNEALNANYYANDLFHIPNGLDIRNTFGGTVGGPIIHGKTFLFFGYEGFRQNYPSPAVDSVPPMAWRTGNFQGSGYTIYDPATTTCVAKNTSGSCTKYNRQPFSGNVIPANRISPVGQAILALYPEPTAAGSTGNYAITGARIFTYDQYVGRIDQTFTDKTRMYALYTGQKNGGTSGQGNGFPNAANTAVHPSGFDYNVILGVTHILSNSMVLDFKASLGHTYTETITGSALTSNFTADKLGGLQLPPNGSTSHQNIAPQVTATGYTQMFGNTDTGSADADADVQLGMTQTIGRHALHYGVEAMDVQAATIGIPGTPNGTFAFTPLFTQQDPNVTNPTQGNAIADILLGIPSSGSFTWNTKTFGTYHYYAVFAQDDFRIRPNLTVNLGLRWDVNKSPSDRHNRMNGNFCLTCTNPYTQQINYANFPTLQKPLLGGWTFAGVDGVPNGPFNVQWNDWQPRVGVSWAVNHLTVIRGGFGIFYSWPFMNFTSNGFSQTTSYIASLDGNLTPSSYFFSGTPYPGGAIEPTGSSAGLETQAGQAITYNNTDRAIRKTNHWSFGVQHELPHSLLIDIEYIGSRTSGLPVSTGQDVVPASLQQSCLQDASICNNNVTNPFRGVLPSNTPLGASATIQAWKLARSYPLFNGITATQEPIGTSHYNAGIIRLERKVKTLDFIFNYTYSNWIDRANYLNDGQQANGAFIDSSLTSDLDPSDVRHYISGNVAYPLPSTRYSGFRGAVLNNWLVDSTVLWGTGTPLAIPSASLTGAPGCTSYNPVGGQTRAHWFNNNVSCYQPLGQWQPRTAPLHVGYLRNPATFYWNPAFHKRFSLPREGAYVQFRMEAVNGANHPNFGAPNETLSSAPKYTPSTDWTGFGTLPTSQIGSPRAVIASLRITF